MDGNRCKIWSASLVTRRFMNNSNAILLALIATVSLLSVGCWNVRTGETEIYGVARFTLPAFPQTGSHKVQVFTEMHYQPSYRSQEGPRLLPPNDSVPVTGKELIYSPSEYKVMQTPKVYMDLYDSAKAAELYEVNCLVCHGVDLRGKGPILEFNPKNPLPADLTSQITINSTDGELFSFISGGGRQGYALRSSGLESSSPMPEFSLLLTESERWMLVQYLRGK